MKTFEYDRLSVHDGQRMPRMPLYTASVLTLLFMAGIAMPAVPLFTHHEHYLPLHTVLEFVAMAISVMIFSIGWNVRKEPESGHLPVLAGAFLAVSLIDFAHTFSYAGMPMLVTPSSPEKAINFWLAGRFVATASLLALAFLPIGRRTHGGAHISLVLGLLVAALVWNVGLYHADWLPRTFMPGSGLTPFKIGAEHLLVAMSAVAAWRFARCARKGDDSSTAWLAAAAWTLGLSELFFTLYQTVTDMMNLLGHVYKASGYLMIYRALFVAGVRRPYQQLSAVQSHLQATLDAVPDLMFEMELDGRCLDLHAPNRRMLVLPPKRLIGREVREVLPAEAAEVVMEALHEAATTGMSRGRQIRLALPNRVAWFELSVAPKATPLGATPRLIALARDITAAKQAEQTLRDSEKRFRELVELSSDWVWAVDERCVYSYASPRVRELLGYEPEELIGREPFDFMPPEEGERVRQRYQQIAADQQPFHLLQNVNARKDGRLVTLESSGMPIFDEAGRFCGYRGIDRDITEKQETERELRIAAIAFDSQESMMVTDADGVILRTNRAFTELTGYEPEEAIGQTPAILKSGTQDAMFFEHLWRDLESDGYWQGEIWNRRKDGELFAAWLTISGVADPDGKVSHFVGAFHDITEQKRAEEQIHNLAFFDPLTRLPNRRLLIDRLGQALAGSERSGKYGGLVFLDLDHFKTINDTLGHDVGDRLLVEVATRLGQCVLGGDTVARLGGDEFVLLMEDLHKDAAAAQARVEQICGQIRDYINEAYQLDSLGGRHYQTTVSVGATLFRGEDVSTDELIKRVEVAMYQAKDAGRDAVRFYHPSMQAALEAHAALENDLRRALAKQQFELYYQPQVDNAGRIVAAEALLRWEHPERGQVSPAVFIPLAEESKLILDIGMWVLEVACAQLKAWESDPVAKELQLAVNVSASQFRQADFVTGVKSLLEGCDINPSRLKLELTESLVLYNIGETIEKMKQLKSLGVAFSIDDFGTGYSSLAYLKRLPIDQLKIDKSFIRNLGSDTNDAAIVQATIGLAKSLDLEVIAEGVETVEQRNFLERHGCNLYQGFLYSRALPEAEFHQLLARKQITGAAADGSTRDGAA